VKPSNPLMRIGTKRLAGWLAVVVVGTVGAFAVATPASAALSDGRYHPQCYTVGICLSRTPGFAYTFTASTLTYDVGPTPYYISIFNIYSGERLAVCGRGTECTTDQLDGYCYTVVAYVGGPGTSMPPAPVQRTSEPASHCFGGG
jgi:hypothetical protein